MRVMVIVKATEDTEKGIPPTEADLASMHSFGEELEKAGIVLVDGAGLLNSSHGRRIAFDGAEVTVTNGPFPNAGALIAGYAIWDVRDMDEALAWGKRWPASASGGGEIELRPLFEWQAAEAGLSEQRL